MGTCSYCGESAGLFHRRHRACEEMHARGLGEIAATISTAAGSERELKTLSARIDEVVEKSWISANERQDLVINCWSDAAEKRLSSGLLTVEDQNQLTALASALSLSKGALAKTGTFLRVVKAAHDRGVSEIAAAVLRAAISDQELGSLSTRINEVAEKSWISANEREDLLLNCWSDAVEKRINGGLLTADDENQLTALASALSLSKDALVNTGAFLRVVKAAVIRDLSNGIVPQRCMVHGPLPFALQSDEKVVWAFANTKYIQDKVRHRHAVEYTVHSPTDTGWFVVTDKNLYFAGELKSVRLPLKKLVSFKNYSDGLGVTREGVDTRPQTFVTGDGWFTYSVVSKLVTLTGTSHRMATPGYLTINAEPMTARIPPQSLNAN